MAVETELGGQGVVCLFCTTAPPWDGGERARKVQQGSRVVPRLIASHVCRSRGRDKGTDRSGVTLETLAHPSRMFLLTFACLQARKPFCKRLLEGQTSFSPNITKVWLV